MKMLLGCVLAAGCAFGQDRAAVSSAEAAACGPRAVHLEVRAEHAQHPTPGPPAGKAMVYVMSQALHERIGIDGKWVGANDRNTYFFVAVEPGPHHLCALAAPGFATFIAMHSLDAQAGHTYYFRARPVGYGGTGGTYALEQLDPDEGRYVVAQLKFGASHAR